MGYSTISGRDRTWAYESFFFSKVIYSLYTVSVKDITNQMKQLCPQVSGSRKQVRALLSSCLMNRRAYLKEEEKVPFKVSCVAKPFVFLIIFLKQESFTQRSSYFVYQAQSAV